MIALLAIACAASLAPSDDTTRPFTDFRPSQHGFLFVNSFDGSPIGDVGIPGASAIAKRVVGGRFGLCGGMSYAAADLYCARLARPGQSTVPPDGSAWYAYIHSRQAASLGLDLSITLKFAEWMKTPDGGVLGLRVQTLTEVLAMRAKVDAGEGAIVGLVFPDLKRGKARKLWEHHQVLGYRFEESKGAAAVWRMFIYDPNYPTRDDAVIEVRPALAAWMNAPGSVLPVPLAGAAVRRVVPGRGGDQSPLRGVFNIPYTARVPPASLFEGPGARW